MGRSRVRSYAKWFGVDLGCALKELGMLGLRVDARYAEAIAKMLQNRDRQTAQPASREAFDPTDHSLHVDEHFASIVGYTSAGFAFGVPWDDAAPLAPDVEHSTDDGAQAHERTVRRLSDRGVHEPTP